uniref:Uncharacterized protein n=1 Tax=Amphimedon queenslandica TaxID=400682 RepID=A0A1X7VE04_AMPQE
MNSANKNFPDMDQIARTCPTTGNTTRA